MAAVVTVRGLASSGFVVNVFSGVVAQSVVLALLNEPGLHDVRPKPFTVWPLVVNGRVVWNRALAPAGAAVELRAAFFDGGLAEVFMERVMEGWALQIIQCRGGGGERWRCGVSHLRRVPRLSSRWSSSRLRVSRRRRM